MGLSDLFYGKTTEPKIGTIDALGPGQKDVMRLFGDIFAPGPPDIPSYKSPLSGGSNIGEMLSAMVKRMQWNQDPQESMLTAPGPQYPGPGDLSQGLYSAASPIAGQAAQAYGQGLQQPTLGLPELNTQSIQEGSQPYLDAALGQFKNQVLPGIGNDFSQYLGGDSQARSSGMFNRMAREGSQLPMYAQGMMMQGRNQTLAGQEQQLRGAGQQVQGGLGGLGMELGIAGQQEQGRYRDWFAALPPAQQNPLALVQLMMGTNVKDTYGVPGTQSESPLKGIGSMLGGIGSFFGA